MTRHRLTELDHETDPKIFEVVVQRARSLSNQIAEMFDVRHQSPQVLLIHNNRVIYDTSHGSIEADIIRNQAKSILSS